MVSQQKAPVGAGALLRRERLSSVSRDDATIAELVIHTDPGDQPGVIESLAKWNIPEKASWYIRHHCNCVRAQLIIERLHFRGPIPESCDKTDCCGGGGGGI